jgi:hypothetical protein
VASFAKVVHAKNKMELNSLVTEKVGRLGLSAEFVDSSMRLTSETSAW